MIDRGQASAMKHGISLYSGSSIAADGNCAFSAALANVNERSCFKEKEKVYITKAFHKAYTSHLLTSLCLFCSTKFLSPTFIGTPML